MGNRCPNGHLQNKKYNAILIKNGPTLCVCVLFVILLQISAFFLLSKFRKGRLLNLCPVTRSVGWSVGRSVGVTIIFFNIYRHRSLLLTQYHFIQTVPIILIYTKDRSINKRFALFTWSS